MMTPQAHGKVNRTVVPCSDIASDGDVPMMGVHDFLDDGKSQTSTFFLCGEKRPVNDCRDSFAEFPFHDR